jgi:hypothetical protein
MRSSLDVTGVAAEAEEQRLAQEAQTKAMNDQ